MRTVRFYDKPSGTSFESMGGNTRDNPKVLHIETDGCIVNIQVGLTDRDGRPVTSVDVAADGHNRGGDGWGRIWQAVVGPDATETGACVRVIMTEGQDGHDQEAGR